MISSRTTPVALSALTASLSVALAAASPQAGFLVLDTGSSGQFSASAATAISADGNVVVGSAGTSEIAARWVLDSAQPTVPETLVSGIRSFAIDVSADGSTIVGEVDRDAFIWTETGGAATLGPRPAGYDRARVAGVSDDGTTLVGLLVSDAFIDPDDGFRWTTTSGYELLAPLPVQGAKTVGLGISGDGEVIVGLSYVQGFVSEAVRWIDSSSTNPIRISSQASQPFSRAIVADLDGSVIVGDGNLFEARRWTEQGGVGELAGPGPLPRRTKSSDVSADGRVVVGAENACALCDERAFRWTASGGERSLYYALLDAGVTDHIGWQLLRASGVSADGRVMCGFGQTPAGEIRAFVAWLDIPLMGLPFCGSPVPNSTGQPGRLAAIGSFVTGDNDVELRVSQLPASSFGFMITSLNRGNFPGAGGSLGVLCLSGDIGRYNADPFQTSAAGTAAVELDLPNTPQPTGAVSVMVGEVWHYQCWHRDSVNGQPVSNFTDGVSVTFY